jgi:hypothetical protein
VLAQLGVTVSNHLAGLLGGLVRPGVYSSFRTVSASASGWKLVISQPSGPHNLGLILRLSNAGEPAAYLTRATAPCYLSWSTGRNNTYGPAPRPSHIDATATSDTSAILMPVFL